MAHYFVSPTDEKRALIWERIYGRSNLPVKYPKPHVACTQRWGDIPVYYLDPTAVPDALLDRIATMEARRMGIPYAEARMAVRREWLIRAEDCAVEETEKDTAVSAPWQLAFPFTQQLRIREKRPRYKS